MADDLAASKRRKVVLGVAALVVAVFCAGWLPFVVIGSYAEFVSMFDHPENPGPHMVSSGTRDPETVIHQAEHDAGGNREFVETFLLALSDGRIDDALATGTAIDREALTAHSTWVRTSLGGFRQGDVRTFTTFEEPDDWRRFDITYAAEFEHGVAQFAITVRRRGAGDAEIASFAVEETERTEEDDPAREEF